MKKITVAGFTLVELIIGLLIISILSIAAIKIYSNQVLRARRMDGINAILAISLAEERYRANNASYGTLAQAWNNVSSSSEGYYTLSITNVSATSYTINAVAQGNQANDAVNGTSCTTLVLAASNGTLSKTPAVCWPN